MLTFILRNEIHRTSVLHKTFNRSCGKSPKELAEALLTPIITHGDLKDVKDPQKIAESVINSFPEMPTTCCMAGCSNCVWLDYADKLVDYYKDGGTKAIKEIEVRIDDPSLKAYLMHEIRMRNK